MEATVATINRWARIFAFGMCNPPLIINFDSYTTRTPTNQTRILRRSGSESWLGRRAKRAQQEAVLIMFWRWVKG
jgi:3-oxoacyl-[acyl-carrier-protein] synthase III